MTPEELKLELKALVGKVVSTRIAGDTLIIYFFENLDDGYEKAISVFINPAWRYQQFGKIVVGSEDFHLYEEDFKSRAEYQETFERMCALKDTLDGARLEDYEVDLETFDMLMKFSDGQVVCNFAESAFDNTSWSYEDLARNLIFGVSPAGIELATAQE